MGIAGVTAAFAGALLIDTISLFGVFVGGLAVLFLVLDWWSWRAMECVPTEIEQVRE